MGKLRTELAEETERHTTTASQLKEADEFIVDLQSECRAYMAKADPLQYYEHQLADLVASGELNSMEEAHMIDKYKVALCYVFDANHLIKVLG